MIFLKVTKYVDESFMDEKKLLIDFKTMCDNRFNRRLITTYQVFSNRLSGWHSEGRQDIKRL